MYTTDTDIRSMPGVGEVRAKAFSKLGVNDLGQLLTFYPRAYEDRTVYSPISQLWDGQSACVKAVVASYPTLSHIRRGMDIIKVRVADGGSYMNVTFFNKTYVRNQLEYGKEYCFFGKVTRSGRTPEMTNPDFEPAESHNVTGRILPVYPLSAGITQNIVRGAVRRAIDGGVLPRETLPARVLIENGLMHAGEACRQLHFPKSWPMLAQARRRVVFEELFVLVCAMSMLRCRRQVENRCRIENVDLSQFYNALPFEPTGAQKRAIADIAADLAGASPMSRLVQGDVGSGKTAVAAAACWVAVKGGYQAAFMAPTEILARQHYETLTKMLAPLGMRIELLTGTGPAAARRQIKARVASGEADIVVGTHALLTADVEFSALGLVVADEQHRFGVQQRSGLAGKGQAPHVLVMSATPIPRTLALLIYGELDVSVIDELPPGRTPVRTMAVGEALRQRVYGFVRDQAAKGRQTFIICPMVEEGEEVTADLKDVTSYARQLSTEVFPDLRVAAVHGKMRPAEKEKAMAAFAAGEADVLVATTVVEVGVDVPNASLMIVENADRFGLSQLHQLRGRVGRGSHESFCVLFTGAGGENSRRRLEIMTKTNDGFVIAQEDLKIRGPGDFFGSRQHGLPELHVADMAEDMDVLYDARRAAEDVLADDPQLALPENAPLRRQVERMLESSAHTLN